MTGGWYLMQSPSEAICISTEERHRTRVKFLDWSSSSCLTLQMSPLSLSSEKKAATLIGVSGAMLIMADFEEARPAVRSYWASGASAIGSPDIHNYIDRNVSLDT